MKGLFCAVSEYCPCTARYKKYAAFGFSLYEKRGQQVWRDWCRDCDDEGNMLKAFYIVKNRKQFHVAQANVARSEFIY